MTYPEFDKGMRQHFPKLRPNKYLDALILHATGKFTLDTMKLDDWLHEQFGEFDGEDGISMRDLLAEKFGEECARFCEEAI